MGHMSPTKTEMNVKGILIYSLNDLFDQFKRLSSNTFIVRCSYFEIYNDTIYDLLANFDEFGESLNVCEDPKKKDFYIKGLKEIVVDNFEECLEILKIGEFNRHYAATSMNHQSSRSHTIFRLMIQNVGERGFSGEGRGIKYVKESLLNFIDLAGSEKVSNH